ncbi:MAG TPA: hypothetical protein VF027_00470 [Sphingomicrobium sp.]
MGRAALELGHPLLGPGAAITGIMGALGALIALQGLGHGAATRHEAVTAPR